MSRLCVSTCRTFSTLHHIHHLIANLNNKEKPVLTRTDKEDILTAPSRGKGSCVRVGRTGRRQLKCLLSSSSYPGDCSLGRQHRGGALAPWRLGVHMQPVAPLLHPRLRATAGGDDTAPCPTFTSSIRRRLCCYLSRGRALGCLQPWLPPK
jgi:hypothetical protein